MTDHYETLGVPRTASHEHIRRAYRERMRAAHPDSSGGRQAGASRSSGSAASTSAAASSAAAQVTRIAEAWNVLSSPARRAAYDLQLATGSAAGVAGRGAPAASQSAGSAASHGAGTAFEPHPDRVYP
ncbi:MAG: J domain-containing protein, partial [Actinobacteria bacterium]|nr:J domain-containing protein [Actinomycetota bacterium]